MQRRFSVWLLAALGVATVAASAWACNIPVFRYALERWRPDVSQFVVFYHGQLDSEARVVIDRFKQMSSNTNAEWLLMDTATDLTADYRDLWSQLSPDQQSQVPYLIVRLQHPRGPISAWSGPLSAAKDSSIAQSPVRQELSKRLLAGDSVVWLLLRSSDEQRNAKARTLLLKQCQLLSNKVQLPDGIGLPGSELFSEVPLFLKFSLLEIDPQDDREQFLINLFRGFQPEAVAEGQPLLVPVFGRGRALEVIPADVLDERLVEDLTAFLCGACSCQVKEQNPGFDLLLSANWDRELFGEGGMLPPPAKAVGEGDRGPTLLAIPPGR
jgi:hypothetical protein